MTRCYVCGAEDRPLCKNKKCGPCMSAYKRLWYERNKQQIKQKQKKYRLDNCDKLKESYKLWRKNNKKKDADRVRAWAEKNPDKRAEFQRKRRARKLGSQVLPITPAMFYARLQVFGEKCAYCGGPFEHWDHFKPLELGGPHILSNMRPACASCNVSKGYQHPLKWMSKRDDQGVLKT